MQRIKKLLSYSACSVITAMVTSAHAGVTALEGGNNYGSLVQNEPVWTLDLGVAMPEFPANPNQVLFESGGDGNGTAIVLTGNELIFFQDIGDFNVSSPENDTFEAFDVTEFSGVVASIRITTDLTEAEDVITLDVVGSNGTTLSETFNLTTDLTSAAGGNRMGVGGVAGDIAGLDESVEDGFPDMAQFFTADYDVDEMPVGANVLGADRVIGTLYTGADAPPDDIPAPSSWGLVGNEDFPEITGFSADKESISSGESVFLSWEVETYDTVVIEPDIGDVTEQTVDGRGNIDVSPAETTTYTLTAFNNNVETSAEVTVLVGAPPTINAFAFQGSGRAVIDEVVVLMWDVLGADSLTIDPGVGDVTGLTEEEVSATETTTYTLTATNTHGSTTAEAVLSVSRIPLPIHYYDAATDGNTDGTWSDEIGGNHWNLTDAQRDTAIVSAGTTLEAAYRLTGEGMARGGAAQPFPIGNRSIEIWVRPGDLDAGHQVIYENGGASNGSSIMMTESGIRYMGSQNNERTIDFTLPIDSLALDDFLQIVYVIDEEAPSVNFYVRDTAGHLLEHQADGLASRGGNHAGLFVWQSGGALGAGHNNLGGRTELEDVSPEGLTNFAGEIALLRIYDTNLTPEETAIAFEDIAGPDPGLITSFTTSSDRIASGEKVTLSWDADSFNTLVLEPDIGDVSNDTLNGGGSREINPTTTTRYTLIATSDQGVSRSSLTVLVGVPDGAVVLTSNTGAGGWDEAEAWSDGLAPGDGKDYLVLGDLAPNIRTPSTDSPVFGGRSLELQERTSLSLRQAEETTATVADLSISRATIRHGGTGSLGLAGGLEVLAPGMIELTGANKTLLLESDVSGEHPLTLNLNQSNDPESANTVEVSGNNASFAGGWTVRGGSFRAVGAGAVGTGDIRVIEAQFDADSPIQAPNATLFLEGPNSVIRLSADHSFQALKIVTLEGQTIDLIPGFAETGVYNSGQLAQLLQSDAFFIGEGTLSIGVGGGDPDSDGDGLTDSREAELGTDKDNPDSDGDLRNDGAEVAAGTDPLDPASNLRILEARQDGDALLLRWTAVADRLYRVEMQEGGLQPEAWQVLQGNIQPSADGDVFGLYRDETANAARQRYYRVGVEN